jgi:hypothetical protein
MHAGYYLLVLACIILEYNAEQCNMHASLYYEYGMMLCINTPAPELRDRISAGRKR